MKWTTDGVRPLGARVIVKLDPQAETYGGVIEIPDDFRLQQQTGTVIAVGPGAYDKRGRRIPVGVQPGERVVFGKWNGTPLPDPEDDDSGKPTPRYFLMEQADTKRLTSTAPLVIDDIYGVVEDADEGAIPEWTKQ